MIFYHGTISILPFDVFDPKCIGSGIVSNGKKFGGFFFTSEQENAEFYTEWFVAKIEIDAGNVLINTNNHPPTTMEQATKDCANYVNKSVYDGAICSDVLCVATSNIDLIKIIEWEFVGDKELLFESYDEWFGDDANQDTVRSFINIMGLDLDYLLNIPIFMEYFNSKQ